MTKKEMILEAIESLGYKLTNNVKHVLNILGMVRSAYHKAKAEFM